MMAADILYDRDNLALLEQFRVAPRWDLPELSQEGCMNAVGWVEPMATEPVELPVLF